MTVHEGAWWLDEKLAPSKHDLEKLGPQNILRCGLHHTFHSRWSLCTAGSRYGLTSICGHYRSFSCMALLYYRQRRGASVASCT